LEEVSVKSVFIKHQQDKKTLEIEYGYLVLSSKKSSITLGKYLVANEEKMKTLELQKFN
jgi:hypothetical protein